MRVRHRPIEREAFCIANVYTRIYQGVYIKYLIAGHERYCINKTLKKDYAKSLTFVEERGNFALPFNIRPREYSSAVSMAV